MSEFTETKIRRWKDRPDVFVRDVFGATPDPWQDEVLRAFPHKRKIALEACKNPGKTCVLAWCSWNFLVTRKHAFIPAVSITRDNLRDNYWKEMAIWHGRSALIKDQFDWRQETIRHKKYPATWYVSARAFSKSSTPEELRTTLAGTHNDNMLYIIDESGSIPPEVLTAAEAGLGSGIDTRIMIAGNKTSKSGILYFACVLHPEGWHIVQITGDPDRKDRAPRVDIEWARDQIKKYGRNNNWVKIDVLSEWPESDENTLITEQQVIDSMHRDEIREERYAHLEKRLGVDIAYTGGDLTVLFPRQGLMIYEPELAIIDPTNHLYCAQIKDKVLWVKKNWKYDRDYLDCTGGYGQGVFEKLVEAGEDDPEPYRYIGSNASPDPQFRDMSTYCFWNMIEAIKGGASLPYIPEMVKEISLRTFTYHNETLGMEPKERFKKRVLGGKSPNYSDALKQTYAEPDKRAEDQLSKMLRNRVKSQERKTTNPLTRFKNRYKSRVV